MGDGRISLSHESGEAEGYLLSFIQCYCVKRAFNGDGKGDGGEARPGGGAEYGRGRGRAGAGRLAPPPAPSPGRPSRMVGGVVGRQPKRTSGTPGITVTAARGSQSAPAVGGLGGKSGGGGGLFCFGLGYVALALASRLRREGGWSVGGTVRSPARAARLKSMGFEAVPFSGARACAGGVPPFTAEAVLQGLGRCKAVLVSVPPGASGDDPVLQAFRNELLERARAGDLDWVGYLSTTSLYGDWEGGWVDEKTEPLPESQGALARLEAEIQWLELAEYGLPVHIFRLGGVYGPRRSLLEAAARPPGELSPSQAARLERPYTSRVHVADVASALRASIGAPKRSGGLYCVVDDDPTSRREAVAYAKTLLVPMGVGGVAAVAGVQEGAVEPVNAPPERGRGGSGGGKRVLNIFLKEDLGWRPAYPSFKEGLAGLASGPHPLDPFEPGVLDILVPPP